VPRIVVVRRVAARVHPYRAPSLSIVHTGNNVGAPAISPDGRHPPGHDVRPACPCFGCGTGEQRSERTQRHWGAAMPSGRRTRDLGFFAGGS
jgi:hypothetical protein